MSDLIGKLLIYKSNFEFTQLRNSLKINLLYIQVRQAASAFWIPAFAGMTKLAVEQIHTDC